MDRLKILVTGCSSGIGYYCAKKMHEEGHIVVASCRKLDDVERLKKEGLHAVRLDLDCSESIDQGIKDTLCITNDQLDVLINNGAYGQAGALEDVSRKALEEQFSTNVFGTHELTIKLMKTLLASTCPKIIQIGSVLGYVSFKYRGAYVASKFALEGLSDTMRLELADTKVKVVLIDPGPITSKFRKNAKKAFVKNIDVNKSRHMDSYKSSMQRLDSDKNQPFTLTEYDVYVKIRKAMLSKRPKARYFVTKPAYTFAFLKRILPTLWLDKMLLKASGEESNRYNS